MIHETARLMHDHLACGLLTLRFETISMDFRANLNEQRERDGRISRYRPTNIVRSVASIEDARDLIASLQRAGIEGAELIRGHGDRLFVRWAT